MRQTILLRVTGVIAGLLSFGSGLGFEHFAACAQTSPTTAITVELTSRGGPIDAAMTGLDRPEHAPTESARAKIRPFVNALWLDAKQRGISRGLFDRAFANFEPDLEIYELLANQPEHVASPWDYMSRIVFDNRIQVGKEKLAALVAVLERIEAKHGVDRHILLAIWGIESSFGTAPGSRYVIRSLATLAIGDARRPQFWRNELLAALSILQQGDVAFENMTGSWAGAMGHTQFMPSSYVAHASDFDGDGRRDIWTSVPDALASTANYLKSAGWQSGVPWGFEVVLPAGFDFANARPGIVKRLAEWQALAIEVPFGRSIPSTRGQLSLLLPSSAEGPAFLVTGNFRAILRYNNSVLYALAVGHLADRIAGGERLAGLWPRDDPQLKRAAIEDLQRRLAALGFDAGPVDGLNGTATKLAIRAYQARNSLPEDGWPGVRLLKRLKADAQP